MFGRKKTAEPALETFDGSAPAEIDVAVTDARHTHAPVASPIHPVGPWDIADAPSHEGALDMGSLLIPAGLEAEVQVQIDEATGRIAILTFSTGVAAMQVQPFAAPKSSGIWDSVRGELKSQVNSSGGLVEEAEGPFGTELRARVTMTSPEGDQVLQPIRFVGVNGPRWFIRAVFLGTAADPAQAGPLEDIFRALIVVRGSDAMAPGEPLPLAVPGAKPAAPVVNPFARGPEITEVR